MNIETLVEDYKKITPDICEHLDTLTELAKECQHITEMGFRYGASAAAFLKGKPKKLISYDLQIPDQCRQMFDAIKDTTDVVLVQGNTLEVIIEPTDMLFIDTLHTYEQLKKELKLHGHKARKYLVFHDTTTYGNKGEDGSRLGLMDAINEYIDSVINWKHHKHQQYAIHLSILNKTESLQGF